jgi:pantoate--beta-alanine ligase
VATVVMKLFNMVQPTVALFGKKDFQQLLIIKEMVRQFNLPIKIVAGETVREPSGLAMSSRNGYLTETQRQEAARLYRVLQHVADAVRQGRRDYAPLEQQATALLIEHGWQADYLRICAASTLWPAQDQDQSLVVLGAAKLGNTRLIDNIEFSID